MWTWRPGQALTGKVRRRGAATGGDDADGDDGDGDGAATRDMETGAAGDVAEEKKQMRN